MLELMKAAGGYSMEQCPQYTKIVGTRAPVEILLYPSEGCVVFDYARSIPAVYPTLDIAYANLARTLSMSASASPKQRKSTEIQQSFDRERSEMFKPLTKKAS